ncbi:MAG: hypothetical protein NTY38_03930, partial [Acidobacteria bacterium]|nr:hypothetical protein [Acidobacteriota bacterium]
GFKSLLAHKVQQAGLDPDLFRSNPALAMGKLVTALNPDLDVLRVDENRGVIEVKDKRTGKTMMLNFEDAKKGKIVFEEEGKGPVTIETNQGDGGVHVRTSDGTMDIGTSAKAPAWIPVYPGAQTQGAMTSTSSGGEGGTVSFLTKDSMEKVGQHYEDMLKATGYQIESQTKTPDALLFSAKNGDKVLSVIIGKGSEGTSIGITYSKK